jgi:ABC-type polysaccharide/polyol phosphate transport system ATPase subunit
MRDARSESALEDEVARVPGDGVALGTGRPGADGRPEAPGARQDGAPAASPAVIVEHVSRKYTLYDRPLDRLKELLLRRPYHRDFWALRDASFTVSRGETLGIIGQNGSGKSTLLQILAGVLPPTSGRVEVRGRVAALLELGAGFNPEFTGRENVFLNGAILGIPEAEMRERFEAIAAFAEIGDFIDQPVKTYSSGMFVRLAFATAINVDPDVLLIDEALAVGDEMFQRRCFRKIEQFQRAGKTIIFVSHDTLAIKSVCSQALLLDGGQVLTHGDPNSVVNVYHRLLAEREEAYLRWLRGRNTETAPAVAEAFQDRIAADEQPAIPDPLWPVAQGEPAERREFRYGDRSTAEIIDYALLNEAGEPVKVIESGERCTIRVTIAFHRPVPEPVIGMLVRTTAGIEVYGTNTWYSNMPVPPQQPGDVLTVEFTQELWLGAGSYFVQLGIAELTPTHVRPLDRRVDVLFFRVQSRLRTSGLANLPRTITIAQHRSAAAAGRVAGAAGD